MPGGRTNAPDTKRNGKRGRPSSLTEDTKRLIRAELLNTGTYEEAAIAGGIHPSTFERWLAQGSRDFAADKFSDYRDFYELVCKANRDIKNLLRGRVITASRNNPMIALKILERRWPKEWGLKIDVSDVTPKPKSSPRDSVMKKIAQIEERQSAAERELAGMITSAKDLAGDE